MKIMTDLPFRRIVAGAAVIMAAMWTPTVLAHAMLVKSEPPRRATLVKSPAQIKLWFNEEVEKDYASLTLLDANKTPVTDVRPRLAPEDARAIELPLPELAPGKYSVKFRVLSVDGHVVDSVYDFTVKPKPDSK